MECAEMTKTQRTKHIEAINNIIKSHGFEMNRFSNWHKDNIKIEAKETNIKISVKSERTNDYIKVFTKPMTSFTLEQIDKIIAKYVHIYVKKD
jgi:acetolactate synthase regulatory subunit